jgi:hypothetical protein
MIDITSETLVSLKEAARHLPRRRGDRPVHVSCIYRWTTYGCKGVILESLQIGGTRGTSLQAVQRFFAALTAMADADLARPQTPFPTTGPKSRCRQIEDAERRLAQVGTRSRSAYVASRDGTFKNEKNN